MSELEYGLSQREPQDEKSFDVDELWRFLRNYWKPIAASALIGALLAFGVSLLQPKVYDADAKGYIAATESDGLALAAAGETLAKSKAKSYVQLATSRQIAKKVNDRLELGETEEKLVSRVTAANPLDTSILTITAKAKSPEEAQKLADTWIAALQEEVASIESGKAAGNDNGTAALNLYPIESAGLPTSPSSPKPINYMVIGLILGGLVGLGYAWVKHQSDTRIRSRESIERGFDLPVLGLVPKNDGSLISIVADEDISLSKQREQYFTVEAFRELTTNLEFVNVDRPPRIVVVTSPTPGDGKSTTAANLALAIAASGQRVVVIDCDLRKPMLSTRFGMPNAAGLTDVLRGTADVEDVIQQYDANGDVMVLASGKIPPNPAEILRSSALKNLVTDLSQEAIIILDAPPLLAVTDAAILSRIADGSLIVVSSDKTHTYELGRALESIQKVRGKALGVIINKIDIENKADSKYYGYYDSYYLKEGEGSSASKTPGEEKPSQASAPGSGSGAAQKPVEKGTAAKSP